MAINIILQDAPTGSTIFNSTSAYTQNVFAGYNLTLPDTPIFSTLSGFTDSTPSVSTGYTIADVVYTDSDGSTGNTAEYGSTIVCTPESPATIVNSGATYSATTPAGSTLVLPNINVSGNSQYLFTFPSVEDVNVTIGNGVGNVGSPDGFGNWFVSASTITNSGNTYNQNVPAESGYTLPNITHIDSNGSNVTLPAQTPFTASTAGATVVLTTSNATPNYGDTITLTITPTGMTPSSYRFWIPKEDNTYEVITQATNTYSWTVDVYGSWTVKGGANTLSATAYDIDGVDITSVHVPTPYSRPADWITIPTINVGGGEEVVYALMAVWDTSHNYVAVQCEGDFTIDWGDGSSAVNYSSGTKAENDISYASVSNLSTRGYRQALVKITPQGGANLTKVDFGVRHTNVGSANIGSQWIEIDQHLPNATTFDLYTTSQRHYLIEQFRWRGTSSVTSYREMWNFCYKLQSIPELPMSGVTDIYRAWRFTTELRIVPEFNFTSLTSANEAFNNTGIEWLGDVTFSGTYTSVSTFFGTCSKLLGIKSLTLSPNVSNMSSFYASCSSLRYAPLIGGLTNVTAMTSFHQGNTSLQYIPPYDLPNVNTLQNFASFSSIRKTVKFPNNLSNVTTIYRMYNACDQLEEAMDSSDGYNFNNVLSARECYSNCSRMAKPHTIDLPNCTSFIQFYNGCRSLEEITVFDTGSGANFTNFVSGTQIKSFPAFDLSSGTIFDNFFLGCFYLETIATCNTSNGYKWRSAFQSTYALEQLPNWDFSAATDVYRFANASRITRFNPNSLGTGTNWHELLRNNYFVQIIENFDWSNYASGSNAFGNLYALRRVIGCNSPHTVSFANSALQDTEIDEIFTDLPTVTGTKIITVTGTPGAATCTTTIATLKGWSVVN
jgi:hypothetical protein